MSCRIMTISGRFIDLLDLRDDDIIITDIAHGLSTKFRFAGHTSKPYTVAQHSHHVARRVPEEDAMWGLLHDASEAYLSDISSPVKKYCMAYKELERIVTAAIVRRFNLPWPMPDSVREADLRMTMTEARQLMHPHPHWEDGPESYEMKLTPLGIAESRDTFLDTYHRIRPR